MSDPQHIAGQNRRRFLAALAVAALVVGVPLAGLAMWWGTSMAYALAKVASPREAFCPLPPVDDGSLRMAEMELRRRIAELESESARRRGQCQVCAEAEAVDVALIVDTSASMRWPAAMDAAAERAKMAAIEKEAGPITETPGNDRMIAEMARTPAGQERMEEARRTALAVLDTLPQRARVHLFSFGSFNPDRVEASQCSVVPVGTYTNLQRAPLGAALRTLRPDASGTPLALSIEKAAAAVKGRPAGTPGFVVVITDGTETCRADPCAAARTARAADPLLSISVIDIARNEQASCLAEATQGQVFAAGRGADVGRMLAEALRTPPAQNCIPRPNPS
ncbi:MAG: VWA domain-containing protein [Alphaproteobacteria bacterium]|nr:VWA domain-containing protein [Alphaproteobacteria bacterium]